MVIENPFHEGEQWVQQRANASSGARSNSASLSDRIMDGALAFIEQQTMLVVGSLDAQGQVWASVLFGEPGFVRAINPQRLALARWQLKAGRDDILWDNLDHNAAIGCLLIELASRRRLRINGVAAKGRDKNTLINVERAYPNCPKYIQRRVVTLQARLDAEKARVTKGQALSVDQQALIAGSDTLFVASAHPAQGVDASHRGGHPGFVHIINPRQLRIPDFAGNNMYNTLGNFLSYPHAGLVFIDFEAHRLLQLTGRPTILWDQDDPRGESGGSQRFWRFDIHTWRETILPIHINAVFMEASPHIPRARPERPKS